VTNRRLTVYFVPKKLLGDRALNPWHLDGSLFYPCSIASRFVSFIFDAMVIFHLSLCANSFKHSAPEHNSMESAMIARRSIFLSTLLSIAIAVSGCTTVRYLAPPTDQAAANKSLPGALSYLQSSRIDYQGRVESQMKTENILANSLVGAGALVMALAVGGANSNAVAGTALVAGTAYGLGNFNLPRQRVLIYMAGVEALSCAQKAVAPIFVTESELTAIKDGLSALDKSLPVLRDALNKGRVILPQGAKTSEDRTQLTEAIKLGDQALRSAVSTQKTVRMLLQTNERAARDLVAAVNGIDEAVVRSLVLSTPELSAVPGLISGLTGLSTAFAPGAGVDKLIAGKLQAFDKTMTATVQTGPLTDAAAVIIEAVKATTGFDTHVQSHLPKQAVPWAEDAFKSCGITQVVQALSVPESPLKFVAGINDRQTFQILGGVKPYFVRLEGVAGLSAKSPIRYDSQAEVILDASKLSGDTVKSEITANIRIIDSSPVARSLDVPVIVAPSSPTTSDSSVVNPQPPSNDSSPLNADLKSLQKVSKFSIATKIFVLPKLPVLKGDTIEVTVLCPTESTESYPRVDLEKALLGEAGLVPSPLRKLLLVTVPATCAT
jgi:hypothetical protein